MIIHIIYSWENVDYIIKFCTSAKYCNTSTILRAVVESNPEVGSSRNRREGLIIISLPMQTRFLSPPEIPLTKEPPIIVSWHLSTRGLF